MGAASAAMSAVTMWAIVLLSSDAFAQTVEVEIRDATPFHAFPPGERFSFDILATVTSGTSPAGLAYQWRDFRGNPLGPRVPFDDRTPTTVTSPSQSPTVGYYGLALLSDHPKVLINAASGSRREIGFVVLPPNALSDREPTLDSPFGIVHADIDDPYLSTWVKTVTWRSVGSGAWNLEMAKRRDRGLRELPLIMGKGWVSDDTAPLPDDFIAALGKKMRRLLQADPLTEHWELGLEENLGRRFNQPFYFQNLQAKAGAVRAASKDTGSDLRLIFQIAGRNSKDIEAFLASDAADAFDILAPHPYAWPNFPPVEEWLESFIGELRDSMRRHETHLPMWFTEMGAPQNDAGVEQMRSGNRPVRGQTREEHAAYLVKSHAISLSLGIDKIFWYNYVDRDSSTTNAEDHFGLVDFWGFPKPSYAAYLAMLNCLEGKSFLERRDAGDVHVYEFADAEQGCLIAWTYPASQRSVPLATLRSGLDERTVRSITDTVGKPIRVSAEIDLDEFPVFVKTSAYREALPRAEH